MEDYHVKYTGDMKVKWMQNKLYLGMAILGLSVPLKVCAAGQDAVNLGQDGNQVSVSLEMSNASEEKITTVSVSLEVKTEDLNQVKVDFQFSPALSETEHGFIYHEDTGRLDIYVSSGKSESLFLDEKLSLGNVQVQPVNPQQSLSADIGYCQNSFHTANSAYGNKSPVVENGVESVTIQIGNGSLTPPLPEPDTENPGSTDNGNHTNTGTGSNGNGGNSHGGGRDEGLYDETTRFTNDPAGAQPITTTVVKREGKETQPVNLTTGTAASIAGKNPAGTGSVALPGTRGKVSVISPKNGPSGILVSKEKGEAAGEEMPDGLLAGREEGSLSEKAGGIFGKDTSQESDSGEILLDQEKGGAVEDRKKEARSRIIRIISFIAAIAAGVTAAGTVAVLLIKKGQGAPAAERRKKKRKKRKGKKKTVRKPSRELSGKPSREPLRNPSRGGRRRPSNRRPS